jgi:hypothetical protein
MFGVAPADEERDQVIGERADRRAPPQHRPFWPDSMPVDNLARVIDVAAGLGDGAVDVVAGKRPADQLAAVDAPDSKGRGTGGSGWSGSGAISR